MPEEAQLQLAAAMFVFGYSHALGCPEGTEAQHFARHAAQLGVIELPESPEDREQALFEAEDAYNNMVAYLSFLVMSGDQ